MGALGKPVKFAAPFAITGSLVFISVQREGRVCQVRCAGQGKIHAPGSTQLKSNVQGWLGSIPVLITYSTFHSQPVNWFPHMWKKFALFF
jgi:hypothetical protein